VNCLNFGNPEHPEVMWQLSEAIDGLAEACRALEIPVIGGNVSLYNESGGADIHPTPVLGVLGGVPSLVSPPPGWGWSEGDAVLLVGVDRASDENPWPLAGSLYAVRSAQNGGRPGDVHFGEFRRTADFVAGEVARICAGKSSDLTGVHDVASGGLALALAEMVTAASCGLRVENVVRDELFSEFPGRFVVATTNPAEFVRRADDARVPVRVLGIAGGDSLDLGSSVRLDVGTIRQRSRRALDDALGHQS
jgi:phosphoribosylformylglycinamidine synthase